MRFDRELIESKQVLSNQLTTQIFFLIGAGIFVWIVYLLSPNFFHHPNLTWAVAVANLVKFWPLFLWGAVLAARGSLNIKSNLDDGKNLLLGATTSVFAGILEEICFRWLYICVAMVSLALLNWMLGTVAGTVIGIFAFFFGCVMLLVGASEKETGKVVGGIALVFIGGLLMYLIWYEGFNNPVYWIYRNITVPLVNLVTLGSFKDIIKNPALPPLFVFGMILANAKFRGRHEYQGPVGMLNAWIFGFIMMHAAVFYGIGTAIVLHVLYDLEFDVIHYMARKLSK